jgi:hypothetical protein
MNARMKIIWQYIQQPLMQLQQRLNLRILYDIRNSDKNIIRQVHPRAQAFEK